MVAKKGSGTPEDVDRFLGALPDQARTTLEKLRRTILAAAPGATEGISYGVPTFKLEGRPLVGLGAAKDHCSFYVMSPEVITAHSDDLKGYATSKGSIQFPAGKPLPAALVRKLVRARIAENEARSRR